MTTTHVGSATAVLPARASSVGAVFLDRVKQAPNAEAFRSPEGDGEPWRSWTWHETETRVRAVAGGLLSLGLQVEQRVAIASTTRLEWIWADLAIMLAGGATTTVYPATQSDDVAFILQDSGSVIVFAEDDTQVAKLRERHYDLKHVLAVVVFDGTADGDWVISLDDLRERGRQVPRRAPLGHRGDRRLADTGAPRDARLHLGHDGPAQGRRAHPRLVDLRGRGGRGTRSASGRPRAVPVAPAEPRVRQGAALRAVAARLHHGRRRPGGPHRRQPRHHPADVHGRGSSDLREGLYAHRLDH